MARTVLTAGFDYGDYHVRSLLGKGAMAEVYLATDRRNGKNVALKVLPRGFGNADTRLRRFEREAHAMTSTKHPNVVAIYEVGKYNRTPFIAMEYVDGPTLREVLDLGSLTPERAFDLARQMAEGLAAAHNCGIVHRDLKPENVMISSDGEIKILDFGLSKPLSQCSADSAESHEVLTLPGTILGTLEYMSPEQASGEPVDERADQFAFGAILYEMLTGTGAFHHESAARVLAAVIEGNILLQVLDDGMITDAYGQAVDFKNAIVIMTSNIGSHHVARAGGNLGFKSDDPNQVFKDRRDLVMAEVKRTLSPEFINRVDEIIVFDALTEDQLQAITRIMVERLNEGLKERKIRLSVTDEVCEWLVQTTCQDRSYGARPLRRAIQRHIEDTLSEALIMGQLPPGQIEVYLDGEKLGIRSAVEISSSSS